MSYRCQDPSMALHTFKPTDININWWKYYSVDLQPEKTRIWNIPNKRRVHNTVIWDFLPVSNRSKLVTCITFEEKEKQRKALTKYRHLYAPISKRMLAKMKIKSLQHYKVHNIINDKVERWSSHKHQDNNIFSKASPNLHVNNHKIKI